MTTRVEVLARMKLLDLYEATKLLRERSEPERRRAINMAINHQDVLPDVIPKMNVNHHTWTFTV